VRAQVDDAVARGATIHVGGPQGVKGWEDGWYYPPTVVTGVSDDFLLMREETFGPILPLIPFDSDEEAVTLANRSPYGLCASVWGRDLVHAAEVLAEIRCGVAFVNNCCFTGPMGGASWGGRKESGYGVTGSRFALHGLVAPRTVCIDRSRAKREMWWYPYTDALSTMAQGVIEVSRSGGAKVAGVGMAARGLLNRWKQ
jgi:acyl-CoA reductase-like NAD-dependent aldehyde dehydrogenase